MSDHTHEARSRADLQYDRMQKRAAEEATARGKREAEARAVEDKTARLKAQRLEREATSSKATPSGEP